MTHYRQGATRYEAEDCAALWTPSDAARRRASNTVTRLLLDDSGSCRLRYDLCSFGGAGGRLLVRFLEVGCFGSRREKKASNQLCAACGFMFFNVVTRSANTGMPLQARAAALHCRAQAPPSSTAVTERSASQSCRCHCSPCCPSPSLCSCEGREKGVKVSVEMEVCAVRLSDVLACVACRVVVMWSWLCGAVSCCVRLACLPPCLLACWLVAHSIRWFWL